MCPRSIQVDTTGRRKCVLAAGNVDFVDIDIIDGCAGDGCIEAGEELLKGLILAAAEHGDGLATLCSDCHGAHWFDVPDDDLTVFGERVDVRIHRDSEGRRVVLRGV